MSRHKTLCCGKDSIIALSSNWTLLQHTVVGYDIVLLVCLKFCHNKQNYVMTENATIAIFFFFFCWNYLIFQLKPAKHKIGEYSII